MLSVVIATDNSERVLGATLAALVPGATAGIVREVLMADAGSTDDTAKIADIAGCDVLALDGPPARRFKAAAAVARAPWLMFLRADTVLDAAWTAEVGRFVQIASNGDRAAVFRGGGSPEPLGRMALLLAAFGARPSAVQGLVITRRFYDALGGHREQAADAERDLIRRIGRKNVVTLATSASAQILD